jgi:uncharacterized membrane protein
MAKRKKKSKYHYYIWLFGGALTGSILGLLINNIAIGFGLGITIGGFIGIITGLGR